MPSDIAKQIVDQIFGDDKSGAIDSVEQGITNNTFDLIQQKRLEFANQWGFDLGDTGQETADEIQDTTFDSSEEELEDVDDGEGSEETETEEETDDETYQ